MPSKILILVVNTLVIGAICSAIVMIAIGQINADKLLIVSAACGVLSLTSLKLAKSALPKPDKPTEENITLK